jgi:hypothetical protein
MKHTPGPWRLRELADDTLAVYGAGEYDIIFPKRGAPKDANARLIAAAPELLAALERLSWCANHTMYENPDNLAMQEALTKSLAAIAKATGYAVSEPRSLSSITEDK